MLHSTLWPSVFAVLQLNGILAQLTT